MATMTKTRRESKPKAKSPVVSLTLSIDHAMYSVEPVPAGEFGTKAFRLIKHTGRDDVYDVVRTHEGLIECDCPSYEMTHRGTSSCCKHGQALVKLGLLDAPAYQASQAPAEKPEPTPHVADEIDEPADVLFEPTPAGKVPASWNMGAWCRECGCSWGDESDAAGECVKCREFAPIIAANPDNTPEVRERARRLMESAPARVAEPTAVEPDPLADLPWERPARATVEKAADVAPTLPMRPALPSAGAYTLDGLADAQAAFYAGMGTAVGDLFAAHMRTLAGQIRATGAKSVSEFEGRIVEMEYDRDERIRSEGFDQGYQARDDAA